MLTLQVSAIISLTCSKIRAPFDHFLTDRSHFERLPVGISEDHDTFILEHVGEIM